MPQEGCLEAAVPENAVNIVSYRCISVVRYAALKLQSRGCCTMSQQGNGQ